MTIVVEDLLEQTDSVSNSTAAFSLREGRSSRTFLLENPEPEDLADAITLILGSVDTAVGDGRLTRTAPLADPVWPWMYASSISSIRGFGQPAGDSPNPTLEVPPIPDYGFYDNYLITVEFTPRPYPVLQDESILIQEGAWYDESGTRQTFSYANEWDRYTDGPIIDPQNNFITAQQGQMVFRSTSGAPPNGPDGSQFAGMPRIFLPDKIVRYVWYQVPFRYVLSSNSIFDKWRGRVNQNEWNGWGSGRLLYLGWRPINRYTPPVPELEFQDTGVFSTEKWCDIEFQFLETERIADDVPGSAIANLNWVDLHHNCEAFLTDRAWHYVSSYSMADQTDTSKWFPKYLSAPLEQLFFDPDA